MENLNQVHADGLNKNSISKLVDELFFYYQSNMCRNLTYSSMTLLSFTLHVMKQNNSFIIKWHTLIFSFHVRYYQKSFKSHTKQLINTKLHTVAF